MEKNTYYTVLGIGRDEPPDGIELAYRTRLRELPPDGISGSPAMRWFLKLSDAHAVLSDPERRRAYDAVLAAEATAPPREVIELGPAVRPVRSPPFEIEIRLRDPDVAGGCLVPIGVPSLHACTACTAGGRPWSDGCTQCRSLRVTHIDRVVHLRLPAGVAPGTYDLAIGAVRAQLHVLVGP